MVEELISPMVSGAENRALCTIPSDAEIHCVVKQLGPAKAPGPEGMTASFYQHYWPTVAPAVCGMIRTFFSSGFLLKQLNHSFLALIPKTPNPSLAEHFRPISLCNVSCKIISKLLADRLKVLLPKLISSSQSAFVPGRII
ncbi:LINE-1 retrotransposable element ORF2 protein [Morella rubra]|uniref:LINE-1 retrotransposable element ORF2 protein n=1 Tax=Morella rubra TaxID=262757 RepID=A0A6A1UM99_9ROSI|nr:LINE-1 retrotransposable element ORF2 protein [Morella rubra]